jgi:hypothetical protein
MGDDNHRPQTSWTERNECSGMALIPTIIKHYRVFNANANRTTCCAQETGSMCGSPLVQKQVTTKGYAWQYGNILKRIGTKRVHAPPQFWNCLNVGSLRYARVQNCKGFRVSLEMIAQLKIVGEAFLTLKASACISQVERCKFSRPKETHRILCVFAHLSKM